MSEIEYQRIPKDLRHPAKTAMTHGWTIRQATANGYRIDSPGKKETFYIPFKCSNAQSEARRLMQKVTRAVMTEDNPLAQRMREELNDPKNTDRTIECSECGVEFVTTEGFDKHVDACAEALLARMEAASAAVKAEREQDKAITPPQVDRPAEGLPGYVKSARIPTPSHRPELTAELSGSGKMDNKEEDSNMGGNTGGYKRGPYNRREGIKPGISRAIYEAMRSRAQHRDEALSAYANAIGAMVEEKIGALTDAETKLGQIFDLLGMDPDAEARISDLQAKVNELSDENERVTGNLKSLKDLLSDIK